MIHWTRDQLSTQYRDWLASLPDYHLYEGTFLLAHGSPRDPDEYIYKKDVVKGSLHHMEQYYKGVPICFFGHSHLPMLISRKRLETRFSETRTVDLDRNEVYLINPGSVGQPRDGVPKAAFGVLDLKRWRFTWVRLDYDFETTGQRIRDAGLDAGMATRLTRGK